MLHGGPAGPHKWLLDLPAPGHRLLLLPGSQLPRPPWSRTAYLYAPAPLRPQGPEIVPYLGQLVAGLGAVLGATGPEVQELALSALASVVAAAGKEFEPYLGGCCCGWEWCRRGGMGDAVGALGGSNTMNLCTTVYEAAAPESCRIGSPSVAAQVCGAARGRRCECGTGGTRTSGDEPYTLCPIAVRHTAVVTPTRSEEDYMSQQHAAQRFTVRRIQSLTGLPVTMHITYCPIAIRPHIRGDKRNTEEGFPSASTGVAQHAGMEPCSRKVRVERHRTPLYGVYRTSTHSTSAIIASYDDALSFMSNCCQTHSVVTPNI